MNKLAATGGSVQQVTVDHGNEGQRIDNFLRLRLKGVPKSRIYRILRRGEVRVNKGRVRPDYRLMSGDVVRIPPVRYTEKSPLPVVGSSQFEQLHARILYEDDGLLVLNKPAGMAVHGGSGLSYGVIEALRAMRPGSPYLELVHRLDRDTSGCLLVAKKRSALRHLHAQLREGRVDKRYLALLQGGWEEGGRRVEAPLLKGQLLSGERIVRVDPDGRAANSFFEPLAGRAGTTLVQVTLVTGRTHQIRVHAAHLGRPVAGDEKYGSREFNQRMRKLGLKRLFLHAWEIRFSSPQGGSELQLKAPLDRDLSSVLTGLDLRAP